MTIVLILILILLLGGWGFGYRSGEITMESPVGLLIILVFIVILVSVFLGPHFGFWRYW